MLRKLLWPAVAVLLAFAGCLHQNQGRIEALPKGLRPAAYRVRDACASVGLRYPARSVRPRTESPPWFMATADNPPKADARGVPAYDPRGAQAPNYAPGSMVTGSGTVMSLLSDDTQPPRHQRFVLRLSSGAQVTVVHNIDLADRVSMLQLGDTVEFCGKYESGGVVHWTHRDPKGRRSGGWLRHRGSTYQ